MDHEEDHWRRSFHARCVLKLPRLWILVRSPCICVVDRNEAFFTEMKDYAKFYGAKDERYY